MSAFPPHKHHDTEVSGIVRWYDERRGFGYIIPDTGRKEGSEDVFLHAEELVDCGLTLVMSGQRVHYKLLSMDGTRCAVNVSLASHRPAKPGRH